MGTSQNLTFIGTAPVDDKYAHPPGVAIARTLHSALGDHGWSTGDPDNWRDVGWSIACERAGAELKVALSEMEPTEWMLQIAPLHTPGLIGRLRGKPPSAKPSDCLDLARAIHTILITSGQYSRFKWCWDAVPDEENSTPEPVAEADSS